MTHSVLFVNTDSIFKLFGLQNDDGTYQNAATVTLESLTHRGSGDTVTGVTLPLDLTYQGGSDGNYFGDLPNSLDVDVGDILVAVIRAVSGAFQAEWTETIRVKNAIV